MNNLLLKFLTLITLPILFIGCNQPEIILLCEENIVEGKFDEVYLVKDCPKHEVEINQLIQKFNQDLKTSQRFGERTFIEQRESYATDFALGCRIDYEKNKCKEINNMDILCIVSKIKFKNGGDTIVFNYFD